MTIPFVPLGPVLANPSDLVAVNPASTLTMYKNSDFLVAVSLALPDTWSVLYWTVKDGRELDKSSDAGALIQIRLTRVADDNDGLQVLNRSAADVRTQGSLVVDDDAETVTIALSAEAIAEIDWISRCASHDFAVHTATGGKPLIVPPGRLEFLTNVTRTPAP